jgi:hypothetical protein
MLGELFRDVRLFQFEQGSNLQIKDAENPDFVMQPEFDLCIRKLRTQRHDAVPAEGLHPAAAKSFSVLYEK